MRIDMIPTGDNPPESLNVVIEVPAGGEPVKYEFDKASGALFVDRILHTPHVFPADTRLRHHPHPPHRGLPGAPGAAPLVRADEGAVGSRGREVGREECWAGGGVVGWWVGRGWERGYGSDWLEEVGIWANKRESSMRAIRSVEVEDREREREKESE